MWKALFACRAVTDVPPPSAYHLYAQPHLLGRHFGRRGHRFVRLAHEAHDLDPLGDDAVFCLHPTRSAGRLKHKSSADRKQDLEGNHANNEECAVEIERAAHMERQ